MWPLLKSAIIWLSAINEVTLCFNVWIFSSPKTPASHSILPQYIPPMLCALIYAVCEPFYVRMLLKIPLQPFIIVMCASAIHAFFSVTVTQTVGVMVAYATRDSARLQEKHEDTEQRLLKDARALRPFANTATLFFMLMIQSAAVTNAALQIHAQSLDSRVVIKDRLGLDILNSFSLGMFLILRASDFFACTSTGRAGYIGQYGLGQAYSQLTYLSLIIVVRIFVRLALGMSSFSFLEVMDDAQVEQVFGAARFEATATIFRPIPQWAHWSLSGLSMILTILGFWLMGKARRDAARSID